MSHLYDKNALYENAVKYCISSNAVITTELGHGTQGIVYQAEIIEIEHRAHMWLEYINTGNIKLGN